VIIGGQYQEKCYGEFQQEMDMLNRAFAELMMEGDAKGRMFSFPIPTYNITEDFEWGNEKLNPVWEMTAKFGIPYFSNFINSDMDPEDARSMCLHPEENIFLKKNDEIKKMTIGKLFEEYKGEKLDKNWFFASSNIETLSLNPKTGELEWAKINKFLKTQGKQLVTITAKDGKTMKVSPEHLVAVYTEKGIKTKKAKELEDSDFLLVMQDASGALKCEDNISEELAWFMGLFIADGNYLYDSRYEEEVLRGIQISFNKQEKSLIEKTKRFIKDYLDYDMKFVLDPRYDNSLRGYIYNSEFANIFKHDYKVRKYNRLPGWIWSSSPANITSFIEGFFDGDGYENGNEIHINDKKLAAELNLLIQLVGISTTLRYRKNSQVIRFQHVLGRGAYNNKIIKDSLHNLIPEFLLEQKVVKDELGKKRYQSYGCKMVGLSSVDRWDISNDKIEFLRNADFAVTEIRDIKINDLDYKQTFYDIELEKNHYFVHSDGNITHNCCRLRLDNKELRKRGGGLFGANPLTGSIGVVTLNMSRIGYQAETKEEFMKRVYYLMDQAKESLEIKRKVLENLTDQGLYPYAKFYLRDIKKRFDQYWKNHFNTIGLNGMNEALLNFMGKNISTPAGKRFSEEVMEKMRERLQQYQEETDNLYNLEATPAEGTAYRFARLDREKFGNQITAANQGRVLAENADPYYTNSTQLPVDFTNDIFTALELQDNLQSMYTGGTVFHGFLGEKIDSIKATKKLVKRIAENFKLPYYTLTPSFSICPVHGYLPGE
ncbi:MAG TPA: anaerobic ribonucleoside-triphosphate reductase, partial [Atribacterota bacterium]|nr:anaerobic ribonucleoside-triphosphate reductase [Atribacterota bacterium]